MTCNGHVREMTKVRHFPAVFLTLTTSAAQAGMLTMSKLRCSPLAAAFT
jgi:hypothetical protein